MKKDPQYLTELHGEFATLKNFIGTRYYQMVSKEHKTDESILDEAIREEGSDNINMVVEQISQLLARPQQEIHKIVEQYNDASTPDSTGDSIKFLEKMKDYLMTHKK